MILVAIQRPDDVRCARALLAALGDRFEFFLLFQTRALHALFGEPACGYGFDAAVCLLNPQNFELIVSFSGARHPASLANLLLLSCFDELGVATLEVQRELFQPGIAGAGSQRQRDEGAGLELGYGAKTVLAWSGDAGIGYPGSALPIEPAPWADFVLVTDGGGPAATKDDYQFVIAVLGLAAKHPEQRFIWKAQPAASQGEATALDAMVSGYDLHNLRVDHVTSIECLVAACSAGITRVSTALVDYQLHQKPVLVHAPTASGPLPSGLVARTFADAAELAQRFEALRAAPGDFRVETGVGPLKVELLEQRLREAARGTALRPDALRVALRYLPQLQGAAPGAVRTESARLSGELARVLERIGVLQRSTLAYKAKKLATRLRKGWSRD